MLVGTVNIAFRDAKGKDSFTRIRIPNGLSFLEFYDFADAMAALINPLTTAEITELSVSIGLDLSGASLKTVAATFADLADKAFVQARNLVNGLVGKFFIPTYDESNNMPESKMINQADVDVAALMTLITDGVDSGGTLVYPVTERGHALSEITIAEEKFRKQKGS